MYCYFTIGAGEANYDGFESNPNRSKKQRREWEVKALLEKIPADLITLDPFSISKVDRVSAKQLQEDREERLVSACYFLYNVNIRSISAGGNAGFEITVRYLKFVETVQILVILSQILSS